MSYSIDLVVEKEILHEQSSTYEEVYSCNITFNLRQMALEANLYDCLWGDLIDGKRAEDIIKPLTEGYAKLKADPEHYKTFDSPNGWGLYKNFVPYVEKYLDACIKYPHAKIELYK